MELEVNLLALDDRPCSFKYFQYICDQFGIKRNIFFSREGIFKRYAKKNDDDERSKKIFILSLDNFIFGGIVNSRKIEYLQSKENLKILEELFSFIEARKNFEFYLYISIPRLLLNFKDNIEKILEINLRLSERFRGEEENLLEIYERYADFSSYEEFYILNCRYEKLRIINFFLSNFSRRKLKNIKEVLIVLDDSQFRGLNFLELRYLRKKFSNFYYLIGLDEIHLLILAKVILRSFMKMRVINFFSNVGLRYKVPIYEGISVVKLLRIYERYLGVRFKRVKGSDYFWKIFETRRQEESIKQIGIENFEEFVDYFERIDFDKIEGKYVVDLTYANGASLGTLKYFFNDWNRICKIGGFWAWNTFSNTLGSSLSHYIISKNLEVLDDRVRKKLVIENFLETVYQTFIRYFASRYSWNEIKIKEAYLQLFERFKIQGVYIEKISLPWNRYFEVDLYISNFSSKNC